MGHARYEVGKARQGRLGASVLGCERLINLYLDLASWSDVSIVDYSA